MKSKIRVFHFLAFLAFSVSLAACSGNPADEEMDLTPQTAPQIDSSQDNGNKTELAPETSPEFHAVPAQNQPMGLHSTDAPGSVQFSPSLAPAQETTELAELKAVTLPTTPSRNLILKFTGDLHSSALLSGMRIIWRPKGYGTPQEVEFHFTCTPSPDPDFTNQCMLIPHYYYGGLDQTFIGWFHTDNLYQVEIDPAVAKVKDTDSLKFEFTVPDY